VSTRKEAPIMKRLVLLALPLALLYGCASSAPAAPAAKDGLPGTSGRTGSPAICIGEAQPCARGDRCCDDMSCQPAGRFGSLCRRPAPG
jgi:hypothetical protein